MVGRADNIMIEERKQRIQRFLWSFCCFFLIFVFQYNPIIAAQKQLDSEDSAYDHLVNRVQNDWYEEMDKLQTKETTIEIKGNLTERLIRSVVNTFSQNITIIKVASLIAGIFCFVLGGFVAALSKLNKGLRRFAIGCLMITIPLLLCIFVFGLSIVINLLSIVSNDV